MKRKIKRFIGKVKRLWAYIPVIWNLEDWDYEYAIDVFKFQLDRLATHLESEDAATVSAKHDASRIRLVLRLMDKVYGDEYFTEYEAAMRKKYGIVYDKFVTGGWNIQGVDPQLVLQMKDDINRLTWEQHDRNKRAHKLLWKLVEHNIQGWWD